MFKRTLVVLSLVAMLVTSFAFVGVRTASAQTIGPLCIVILRGNVTNVGGTTARLVYRFKAQPANVWAVYFDATWAPGETKFVNIVAYIPSGTTSFSDIQNFVTGALTASPPVFSGILPPVSN